MESPQNDHATAPRPRAITEIAEWLRIILPADPSSIFEIRALDCSIPSYRRPHNRGGYFSVSQINVAAEAAARLTMPNERGGCGARGVYLTLNPVSPDLLSRRANRVDVITPRDSTTSDRDILSRRWLFIDCDPVRPAGVSSSESEHEAAHRCADSIRDHLVTSGWPLPVESDSGNGFHLLYRIDTPNDEASTATIQRCLQALSARFSSPQIDIDTSVFNASRICKLYGTISRKGDSTEQRPHRRSRIIAGPREGFGVVPVELLQKLASETPATTAAKKKSGRSHHVQTVGDRIQAWLQKRKASISGSKGHNEAWFTACTLVRGYNLTLDLAFPYFAEWNQTCEPPWSDRELMHKLEEAEEKADGEPGYMLTGNGMPSNSGDRIDVSGVTFAKFTGDNSPSPPTSPSPSSTPQPPSITTPLHPTITPGNRDGPPAKPRPLRPWQAYSDIPRSYAED